MVERKVKAYCQIITCVNNLGTKNKNEFMFRYDSSVHFFPNNCFFFIGECLCFSKYRVPSKGNERLRWIESIKNHQEYPRNRKVFNVCLRHFESSDLIKKGETLTLKPNAIPTIFIDRDFSNELVEIIGNDAVDEIIHNSQCNQCPFLLQQISDLKHEILLTKAENSILVQKLQLKNLSLEKHAFDKAKQLATTKKQLSDEKNLNIKLNDILDDLKLNQYITDEDKKFLNVITLTFSLYFL